MRRRNRLQTIWSCMNQRCKDKNHCGYKNYGGRGVKILWNSYEEFYNDMHESYENHVKQYGEKDTSIDRIDSNGNYCKENCRWATIVEQNNNHTNNHSIEYRGKTYKSISILARETGVDYNLLKSRINNGWAVERAVNTELKEYITRVTYKGKEYDSLGVLCNEVGVVEYGIAKDRIERGWTIEDAVEIPQLRECKRVSIEYKGVKYESVEQLYREVKPIVTPGEIRRRLVRGWSIDEAIEKPLRKKGIVYDGKEYKGLRYLCEEKGIKYGIVKQRLNKLGWDLKRAIETPILKHYQPRANERLQLE